MGKNDVRIIFFTIVLLVLNQLFCVVWELDDSTLPVTRNKQDRFYVLLILHFIIEQNQEPQSEEPFGSCDGSQSWCHYSLLENRNTQQRDSMAFVSVPQGNSAVST